MPDIKEIVESIKALKVWEFRELVIAVEDYYGIAAPGGEHLMAERALPDD